MGLCLGKTTTAASPSWLELPPEIAGEILSRLPTHDDRLSFKTVCRQWRLAARQQGPQLLPAVPCINLGHGAYQSMVTRNNGVKVHRRRFGTPKDFHVGSAFGSWVMYEHMRSHRSFLCDPFSPSTPAIEVPCDYDYRGNPTTGVWDPRAILLHEHALLSVKKIIVCSPHLVVAMTSHSVLIDASADFACFRPETTVVLWARDGFYRDIAFHRGKIFAIDSMQHLFSHWLNGEAQSQSPCSLRENFSSRTFFQEAHSQSWTKHVITEGPAILVEDAQYYHHLVTSSNEQKLLMVRWSIPKQTNDIEADSLEMNLQVFEADLHKGRWSEMKDLGSQVLFVGRTGSRALLAEGLSEHYYGPQFRGGNHVFVLGHDWAVARERANAMPSRCLDGQKLTNGIPRYCVYDMVTGKTTLVLLNGGHGSMKSSKAEWFFPSE